MENRSFDHLLGWLPNADGKQSGLSYLDNNGVRQTSYPLMPDFTGCGHRDPDHSYSGSRTALDNGAMDGFLRAGKNDRYAIGYYTAPDIPFMATLAQNYLTFSRYFASILSATFPNRLFQWAAQTDRLGDEIVFSNLPTIFDRLDAARVSHRYFFSNLPFTAIWGLKYLFSTGLVSEFLSRAADGTLPAVSFIDPSYTVFDDGTGNDDHPHADIRNGDAFLSKIFQALTSNNQSWQKTVLIINFDEWGGFFEHIAPPRAAAPNNVDTDLVNGQALLGFRVPAIIASPFTRGAGVSNMVCDHTSVLKLIEWRWGLQPLTSRDASPQIGNPAAVMNFARPDRGKPSLPTASTVFAPGCFQGSIFDPESIPAGEREAVSEATRGRSRRALSAATLPTRVRGERWHEQK